MTAPAASYYALRTAHHIRRAARWRRQMGITEWSETIRRMEGGKRFRVDYAPYEKEMMETPFREDVQMSVFMMASRLGKTESIMNIIGHGIAESPRRILVMYPTISQAEKWSKETLMNELVHPTPDLDDLIGDGKGRRKSGNTILHKLYPGGLMNIFGSNAPGEMRRAKGNLICADEIDAIVSNDGDEGDALEILWVRGSEFDDCIKIAASYPSIRGRSKIESLMLMSDWREWVTPCQHCFEPFVMHRKQLRYDRDKPEDAWLECPKNGCKITDKDRVRMVRAGEWVPTREFTGIAGFQANRMISPHPVQKGFASHLHWIAVEELKLETAENREKAERVIVNTFDGEPYSPPSEEKPDPETLEKRARDYLVKIPGDRIAIPDGVLVITIGADVQGDRVELEFVGHGENQQTWGLGYHIIHGEPTEKPVWEALDKMTLQEFQRASGQILKPAAVCIDSKYRPDFVRAYTRTRAGRRIYAVVGSTVLGKPIVSAPTKDRKAGCMVYEIGTHEAKSLIYQRAGLDRMDGSEETPPGFMHFPKGFGYAARFFRQLLCEDVELKKANDGDWYQFFSNPNRLRNEALDVRAYAMAAEKILNPNYPKIAEKYGQKADKNGETMPKVREYRLKPKNFVTDL